ncbi:MAG TPA: NUDIX domain-containing protein [Gammaproteobacteria bacterium]|nr:NUDIX domain-containing protein [Gammaproteobacteria bacterium]
MSAVRSAAAVHVVVGLISDLDGRWLVNRRQPETHMAGFWEFPGGKSLTGEDRFEALRRELNEELGIEVLKAEPFMTLVHDYPDKRVRLDIWRVLRYRGAVDACEGQLLRWLSADEIPDVGLLPADLPIVDALLEFNRERAGNARPE